MRNIKILRHNLNKRLLMINTSTQNFNSSGSIANNSLTSYDVISCAPNTIYGSLLLSCAQQTMPNKKIINLIVSKCIKYYSNKIKKRVRYFSENTKSLTKLQITKISELALESVILDKVMSSRVLAKKMDEKRTTSDLKIMPVYIDFHCLIAIGLARASKQFEKRLTGRPK